MADFFLIVVVRLGDQVDRLLVHPLVDAPLGVLRSDGFGLALLLAGTLPGHTLDQLPVGAMSWIVVCASAQETAGWDDSPSAVIHSRLHAPRQVRPEL